MQQPAGSIAERVAADHLRQSGLIILERNWKVRSVEIDIIALNCQPRRATDVYFIEVKYRRSASQGGGIAAITMSKLKQMRYGSELFMSAHDRKWQPHLGVIELSGPDYSISYRNLDLVVDL